MPVDKNPSPTPSQTNGLNSNPSQNSPKKSNHHQKPSTKPNNSMPKSSKSKSKAHVPATFLFSPFTQTSTFCITHFLSSTPFIPPPTLGWKSIIRCYTSHGLSHQFIAMRTSGKYPDRQATVDRLEVG